jgi:hypothetical protein
VPADVEGHKLEVRVDLSRAGHRHPERELIERGTEMGVLKTQLERARTRGAAFNVPYIARAVQRDDDVLLGLARRLLAGLRGLASEVFLRLQALTGRLRGRVARVLRRLCGFANGVVAMLDTTASNVADEADSAIPTIGLQVAGSSWRAIARRRAVDGRSVGERRRLSA